MITSLENVKGGDARLKTKDWHTYSKNDLDYSRIWSYHGVIVGTEWINSEVTGGILWINAEKTAKKSYYAARKVFKIINTEDWNIPSLWPFSGSLVPKISEFHHEPKPNRTFTNRFEKCKVVFRNDLAHSSDVEKVSLLLRTLGTAEFKRLTGQLQTLFSAKLSNSYPNRLTKSLQKNHFKYLPFLSNFREFCQSIVCCRILRMIEETDKITLEYLANECVSLDIKCDSGMTQLLPGEQSYVNLIEIIFFKVVSLNVFSPCIPLPECWLYNELRPARFGPYKSHFCYLYGKQGRKEKGYQKKTEFRKESMTDRSNRRTLRNPWVFTLQRR